MEDNNTLPKTEPTPLPVRTSQDVMMLLENLINDVRTNKIDAKRANSIGYLASLMLKAIDQRDLATKIRLLENTFKGGK